MCSSHFYRRVFRQLRNFTIFNGDIKPTDNANSWFHLTKTRIQRRFYSCWMKLLHIRCGAVVTLSIFVDRTMSGHMNVLIRRKQVLHKGIAKQVARTSTSISTYSKKFCAFVYLLQRNIGTKVSLLKRYVDFQFFCLFFLY